MSAARQQRRSAPPAEGRHLHTFDEISDKMRARMLDLCHAWKLRGHIDGHDFVAFNPLRADKSLGSFRVCISGPRAGLVKDFAGGDAETWSPISFTAALWFGDNQVQAIKWARSWLGLDGTDPNSFARTQRAVAERDAGADRRQEAAAKDAKRIKGYAWRLWEALPEGIRGTPAETYLRGRGIDIRAMHFDPGALRYHPDLTWREDLDGVTTRGSAPALVTIIQDGAGKFLALHRTYLEVHADGRVTKSSALRDPKKVLAAFAGGYVSIQKGSIVNDITGEIRKAPPLSKCTKPVWVDVTEGIENALSVAMAYHDARVIAAVSLANMANIALPPIVEGVVLWRDNDAAGSVAEKGFMKAVAAFQRAGKLVRVVTPPAGIKDVNDVLRGE